MQSIHFTLGIKTVSKSNAYRIAGKRLYKTNECLAFELAIAEAARKLWSGDPSDKPFKVAIHIGMPDHRRRDLDGPLKSILDALNGIAWTDDSQVMELHVTKSMGENAPYLNVSLAEI